MTRDLDAELDECIARLHGLAQRLEIQAQSHWQLHERVDYLAHERATTQRKPAADTSGRFDNAIKLATLLVTLLTPVIVVIASYLLVNRIDARIKGEELGLKQETHALQVDRGIIELMQRLEIKTTAGDLVPAANETQRTLGANVALYGDAAIEPLLALLQPGHEDRETFAKAGFRALALNEDSRKAVCTRLGEILAYREGLHHWDTFHRAGTVSGDLVCRQNQVLLQQFVAGLRHDDWADITGNWAQEKLEPAPRREVVRRHCVALSAMNNGVADPLCDLAKKIK